MKTQIAEILAKYNVKKSAEIMAEIENILKSSKSIKEPKIKMERERTLEDGTQEVFCRDFQVWLPREFGSFDKEGKYNGYSKCSVKAFGKFSRMQKSLDKEVMALALDGKVNEAKELKASFPEKASEWVKTQKWHDFQ